jgi:carbon monoxide dehydrogenase subunit G
MDRFGSELNDPRSGVSRLRVGYLTGTINVDWALKFLTSKENRARLEISGRVVAEGLVRVHRVDI